MGGWAAGVPAPRVRQARRVTLCSPRSPLSPEKGTEVLEDVARLLDMPAGVFSDIA